MLSRSVFATVAAASLITGMATAGLSPAVHDLIQSNPGVRTYEWNGNLSRIYGAPFSHGASIAQSADAFIRDYAQVFGLESENLVQRTTIDGWDIQPVMLDHSTGEYKFGAVFFEQTFEGIPVYGSELMLMFRNQSGERYPAVLASSTLKDLGDFQIPAGVRSKQTIGHGSLKPASSDDVRTVIYVDEHGEEDEARLSYVYISEIGQPGQPVMFDIAGNEVLGSYDRVLVIADAMSGVILHRESLIRTVDVGGNAFGWATPGTFPDTGSNPEQLFALPNFDVEIVGGNSTTTDLDGNFVISHGGSSSVTVRSEMVGPSLTGGVNDNSGGDILIDLTVTPPGPADFEHNTGKTAADTAEVNAMLRTSMLHTFVGDINPAFPGLSRSFRANVNLSSTCNAYYDGSSINFFSAGGGCPNTAYSTVVYHEYGHKMVDDAASFPSGDYHEGMADCVAIVITDDPHLGEDFFGPGTGPLRDGVNNVNYPCSGEIHFCGEVMSGCIWETRQELFASDPVGYLEVIQDLTINSIAIHTGGVDPGVTIDFLTLDDNDGDIGNGTPHYNEINAGFTSHNMPAPPLTLLDFDYPGGRPEFIDPDGGTTFQVNVSALNEDPQSDTGLLYYSTGGSFTSISMTYLGGTLYDATFPAIDCGLSVDYYVSAETIGGVEVFDPGNAPLSTFSTISANNVLVLFEDNFETDKGWVVTNENLEDGPWMRGVPVNDGRSDPPSDFDGSGQCYVTDNVAGNSDVDGGPTRVTSPSFDMSAGDGVVSYARWFANDDNDIDRMTVEISNNDGSTWTLVRTFANTGEQWLEDAFTVSDYVMPTSTMKLRFNAKDNPNDSVTEAGLDAVKVTMIDCGSMLLMIDPMIAGQDATFQIINATDGELAYFVYSLSGTGQTFVPALDVTLGLSNPKLAGSAMPVVGVATLIVPIPGGAAGTPVWLQGAQFQRTTDTQLHWIN